MATATGVVQGPLDKARAFFTARNWPAAADEYAKVTESDALTSADYFNWGYALAELPDGQSWQHAIEKYRESIRLQPKNEGAYNNIGLLLEKFKTYSAAMEEFQKATDATTGDPNYSIAHRNWGDTLYLLKRYEDACAEYARAAAGDAPDAIVFNNWGVALNKLGRNKDAIARYETATRLDPNYATAYRNWAEALVALEQYDEAASQYAKAASAGLTDATFFNNWGRALYKAKRYAEAVDPYRKATEVDPKYAIAYNNCGNALYAQQLYPAAAEQYQKATEADPKYADAYYNWGLSLYNQQRYDDAIGQFAKTTEVDPNYADAYNSWGNTLRAQSKYEESIVKYQKTVELNPHNADAYNNWGNALLALNKCEDALQQYRRAVAENPKFTEAHYNCGYVLNRLGKPLDAIEAFKKATEANPDYALAFARWGDVLLAQKKPVEAAEKYGRAMALDPKTISYLKWLRAVDQLPAKNRDAALDAARAAINREDPPGKRPNLAAYMFWGNSLASLGQFRAAATKMQPIFDTLPKRDDDASKRDLADAYVNLGWLLNTEQRYSEAFDKFKEAIRIRPDSPLAYNNWGAALIDQRLYSDAIEKLKLAQQADTDRSWAKVICIGLGNALTGMGCMVEGIEQYQKAIDEDRDYQYAYHSIANTYGKQGKYELSYRMWERARTAYEKGQQTATENDDGDFFEYYGGALHEALNDLREAERVYQKGLEINPSHPGLLTRVARLHLAMRDEFPSDATNHYWNAWQFYKKAEKAWQARLSECDCPALRLRMADLCFMMERYDDCEAHVRAALTPDPASSDAQNQLGALYSKREEYTRAVACFKQALSLDPASLRIRSNLAEAYLNSGQTDASRAEYQRCLDIAPNHVESLIGLGRIYLKGADDGDTDMYQDAVKQLEDALQKGDGKRGSKKLSKKESADIYYSIAYAKVKQYEAEASKLRLRRDLLNDATKNFEECRRLVPDHHGATVALARLEERKKKDPETAWERRAPWVMVVPCATVFLLTQSSFFFYWPWHYIDTAPSYTTLTFVSIVLMAVGCYLPKVLKLKVAGIELEKSAVEQIGATGTLKITSPATGIK